VGHATMTPWSACRATLILQGGSAGSARRLFGWFCSSAVTIDVHPGRSARPWHEPTLARLVSCRAWPGTMTHRVMPGQPTCCNGSPGTGPRANFMSGQPAQPGPTRAHGQPAARPTHRCLHHGGLLMDKRRIHLRSASVRTYTFFITVPRFLSIRGARGLQALDLPILTNYSNPNL
jgi:hypothetical protein